jgi:hypothetical protein
MKEHVHCALKEISIPLEVLVDEISAGLEFCLPELVEKTRANVTPIGQRGPNIKQCSNPSPWLNHMLQIALKVCVPPIG